MSDTTLAVQQPSAMETKTPMEMVQVAFEEAIKQGAAAEMVTLILEQQRWLINHNEEEAFNTALARIQKDLQKIPKRGINKETNSKYALAEDIDAELDRHLIREGMTLNFEPGISEKNDEVLIIGVLSLGAYSRRYPLPMPADGKGAKGGGVMSRTHATGSAVTYGKRYLKDMIFNLTFTKDDDGNAAGMAINEAAQETAHRLLHWEDPETLKTEWWKENQAALKADDSVAVKVFFDAYKKRRDELAKIGGAK